MYAFLIFLNMLFVFIIVAFPFIVLAASEHRAKNIRTRKQAVRSLFNHNGYGV